MKKFLLSVIIITLVVFGCYTAYYRFGIYIDFNGDKTVSTFMTADESKIYMIKDGEKIPFEIRGVNMGVAVLGKNAGDYAIDESTYMRWFGQIQELGANTLRVYTIQNEDFYNAFYKYNCSRVKNGCEPLYLLHGVWVDEYAQNSHHNAFDKEFIEDFKKDCVKVVDIIHGCRDYALRNLFDVESYRNDISKWVIGYIIGIEWEDVTVEYTNHKYPERNSYSGKYARTENASPFEAMLCETIDNMIAHETERFKEQRLIAFSNWPTTDPFDYSDDIKYYFKKCAKIDAEHIKTTPKSGSTYCRNFGISFERPVDFVIVIDGKDNSRVWVQERYDALKTMYGSVINNENSFIDPVDVDSPKFNKINLLLQLGTQLYHDDIMETFDTGKLIYGNANPDSKDFNSLADFIFSGDNIEMKIPWQLLNFANPSDMMIHDDYYEHYGVEYISIDELYAGVCVNGDKLRTKMYPFELKGWGYDVTYHERLKKSYYMLKEYWAG